MKNGVGLIHPLSLHKCRFSDIIDIQLAHSLDQLIRPTGWQTHSLSLWYDPVTAVELSASVALPCLSVCDYLTIQTVSRDPTKEKALLSAHQVWREEGGEGGLSVFPPSFFLLYSFHQPQSLYDSRLSPPTHHIPLFLCSPPHGLISWELRSQLKMKMNSWSHTFCQHHWELGDRHQR